MNWDLTFLFSIRGVLAGTIALIVIIQILRSPFFGLLVFLFFITVQPHQMEIFPGIETFPIVKFFSFFIFLSIFIHHSKIKRNDNWFWSTETLLMLLFGVVLATSGSFSEDAFEYFNERFIPVIIIYILVTYLITKDKDVKLFFYMCILFTAFISLYGILGYHEIGGIDKFIERDSESDIDRLRYVGSMSGPNDLSLVLVCLLPFIITFFTTKKELTQKIFFAFIFFIHIYAIRLTYSRGGFLALASVFFLYGITSKKRVLVTSISILLLGIFFVSSNPDYRWRILSINKAAKGEEIDKSSLNRIELWKTGINMMREHPLNGIGIGQFAKNVFQYLPPDSTLKRAQVAHNSFITIAAEAGVPGLILYTLIILKTSSNLLKVHKLINRLKERENFNSSLFARPLIISLTSILVSGFFLSQAYNWIFYIFVALAGSIKNICLKKTKLVMSHEKNA